jgi:hypothetical protein
MCRLQELRPYLKGQGHTYILKFHIIFITINRYTQLCPGCNFVMHERILKELGINVYNIKIMCRIQ